LYIRPLSRREHGTIRAMPNFTPVFSDCNSKGCDVVARAEGDDSRPFRKPS